MTTYIISCVALNGSTRDSLSRSSVLVSSKESMNTFARLNVCLFYVMFIYLYVGKRVDIKYQYIDWLYAMLVMLWDMIEEEQSRAI